jgi:uncharacterized protein
LNHRYNSIGEFLRERFGERVFKVSLDSGCGCPHRDAADGLGGCAFCHREALLPSTAREITPAPRPIREQLEEGIDYIEKRHGTRRVIASFQSGTNTSAAAAALAPLFREAATHPQVAALSISTRPDAIAAEHLDLFRELASRTFLWVELGLQSAHEQTLAALRRGHTVQQFAEACRALSRAGIRTCAHVILGLPGETPEMMRRTAEFLSETGVWGVKIHNLHVLAGTEMERRYREGAVTIPTLEEYAGWVVDFLEALAPSIIVHRVNGHSPRQLTVAPAWSVNKLGIMNAVERELSLRDSWQGKKFRAS